LIVSRAAVVRSEDAAAKQVVGADVGVAWEIARVAHTAVISSEDITVGVKAIAELCRSGRDGIVGIVAIALALTESVEIVIGRVAGIAGFIDEAIAVVVDPVAGAAGTAVFRSTRINRGLRVVAVEEQRIGSTERVGIRIRIEVFIDTRIAVLINAIAHLGCPWSLRSIVVIAIQTLIRPVKISVDGGVASFATSKTAEAPRARRTVCNIYVAGTRRIEPVAYFRRVTLRSRGSAFVAECD
jgi:hypothetical protein